jgi:uncharacterized protein
MVKRIQGGVSASVARSGYFCWTDLGALKPTEAKAFYGRVVGWTGKDFPLPQGGDYTLLHTPNGDAAGLYEQSDDQKSQKIPPHWLVYLAVEDAEATAKQAKALGGRIVVDAYDVEKLGRMAILLDPTGAMFAIWETGSHGGMTIDPGEPGSLCWCELMTPDLEKVAPFYAALFGWIVELQEGQGMRHARCRIGDAPVADMMAIGSGHGRVPPHWLAYFAVESCAAASKIVGEAGGRTLVAPSALTEGTTFSIVRDPEGAIFGLMGSEDLAD